MGEARMRPCSITFQYMYGLGTRQSCGPKSLWSICWQHQDCWSRFCRRCNNLCWVKEAEPLGLEVSWSKTKVQVFGSLLGETVQSIHACSEDIDVLDSFTYFGSMVHNNGGSRQEVLRWIGLVHGIMDSLSMSIWHCWYLCIRKKVRIFKLWDMGTEHRPQEANWCLW